MMNPRSLVIAVLVSAALAATATTASADGVTPVGGGACVGGACYGGASAGGGGYYGNHGGGYSGHSPYPSYYSLGGYCFGKHSGTLPAFQAAPWYLYWPYDGHFLTPAPVTGAFYGPPGPGNFPVNPYFPGPGYGYGSAYGPIPGGAAPAPRQ